MQRRFDGIARAIFLLAGMIAWAHATAAEKAAEVTIRVNRADKRMEFAAREIAAALESRGYRARQELIRSEQVRAGEPAPPRIHVSFFAVTRADVRNDEALERLIPEGFLLLNGGPDFGLWAVGKDEAGAMYGGLELAEQIRVYGVDHVRKTLRNPYMPMRGTKFNVPLDLRNPSYSDMSDAAQANIATVWDFAFWTAYLDQLARDRYNFVSLWNLHPFPSMVKVPGYENVALDDVWRTKAKLAEDYSTRTIDLLTPAMLADKDVVKKITIDRKIAFWRRVMEYARNRNIQVHIVTWNIFTYGVDGKYGITDAIDNPKTVDYFRASVRAMFDTYPLLAGIGLTAGENMGEVRMYSGGVDSFDAKENWLLATYGQGVLEAARAEPKRRFRLIHRQHETRAQDIAATFKPVIAQPNVDFVFSFKYAQAHALSSTTQTFHRGFVESLGELETLWTLRNDDALMFRWAAPDFVREFVTNIPYENTAGYYVGSDMWVWGREFLDKNPRGPRQLESDKHWLHFLLWGRLGYDPTLDNERITALVAQRFPGADAGALLGAWQNASMIYPLVTGFHWADFDFQWYIEGCRSRPGPAKTASGFHSVDTFINQKVHPGTDNLTIPLYVEAIVANRSPTGTTPRAVADEIDARADAALTALTALAGHASARSNPELGATLDDIQAMALLGKYYAAKIRGATELALYRATRDAAHQRAAVDQLTRAAGFWKNYTARTAARYRNPLWTNRVGIVDFQELDAEVLADIEIARAALP